MNWLTYVKNVFLLSPDNSKLYKVASASCFRRIGLIKTDYKNIFVKAASHINGKQLY